MIVVGFDGLDKELIEDFDLENVKLAETAKINNTDGIKKRSTSELLASFITGETHEEHGVTGLETNTELREKMRVLTPQKYVDNIRGFTKLRKKLDSISTWRKENRRYEKADLNCDTVFEKVEHSRAMFVPSYNPSITWASKMETQPLIHGKSSKEALNFWDTREYRYRKESLWREFNLIGRRPLLMIHFHRPDLYQHHYGEERARFDERKLREVYAETDSLAGEILRKSQEAGHEKIIFMSDRGLPEGDAHNRNAFYSTNFEAFDKKTPHITEFHDLILEEIED